MFVGEIGKRQYMKKILLVLILSQICFLSAFGAENYFPLQVGNEWNYVWNDSSSISQTNSISDSIIINNKSYFIFHDNAWADHYFGSTTHLIRSDKEKILEYYEGNEQVLFDFTIPHDSSYKYINYRSENIDTLVVRVYRHEKTNIFLEEYDKIIQFMFDKPINHGDEYNYFFTPNTGIISKHFMRWPNHETLLISSTINNHYKTNRIKFFPDIDTISVTAGCSFPHLLFNHKNQTDLIDSVIITEPYLWFEGYKDPNYYGFKKCGFLIFDIDDQYDYELWYSPIDCQWDTNEHIILFDTIDHYHGDFDIKLKVLKDDVYIDSLSHFMRAIAEMSINDENKPTHFHLSQNYPNPFNPATMINYQLPMTSEVNLSVFNMLGQKIATLVNERKSDGSHQVIWDASEYSSGIYFYKIESGDFVKYQKCLLVK